MCKEVRKSGPTFVTRKYSVAQQPIICKLSYLSFWCKYNPVLLQDGNQRHLHLK